MSQQEKNGFTDLPRGDLGLLQHAKMEPFVIIVKGFQPLTIIKKHSILDVAAALNPPLLPVFPFLKRSTLLSALVLLYCLLSVCQRDYVDLFSSYLYFRSMVYIDLRRHHNV